MLAIDLIHYLSVLLDKADKKEDVEVTVNGMDIIRVEYVKNFDSNNINDELIQITTD